MYPLFYEFTMKSGGVMFRNNIYLTMKKESGQSLVQFALILPIILLLFFTSVEFARIIDTKIILNSAACEIVRSIKKNTNINLNINTILIDNYAQQLNLDYLNFKTTSSGEQKVYYKYHARSSVYGDFVEKTSYYKYEDITVYLNYKLELLSPVSNLIFKDPFIELSSKYSGKISTGGFEW